MIEDIKGYLQSGKMIISSLFAGPCVIEGEDMVLEIAEKMVVGMTSRLNHPLCVYMGSIGRPT